VVSADEDEKIGYRSILNFGHTIGHAIEAAASYSKSINHGEAVACGMLCACDIAVSLDILNKKIAARVEAFIKRAGLPTHIKGVKVSKVMEAASYDKKIQKGKRRWVLPKDIGHVLVCDFVPADIIMKAVANRLRPT